MYSKLERILYMSGRRFTSEAPISKEILSPHMVGILSALRESDLRYTDLKFKLINPEKKKPYTDRALSLNLDNLQKRGLIERPESIGHRPYRITEKGIEEVLKAEDYIFTRQNNFYKAFDIETYAPIPPPLRSSVSMYTEEWIDRPNSTGRLENLDSPEKIVSDYPPIFPLSTRAIVKLNENGRLALEPWLEKMRRRYGITKDNESEQEWLYKEVVETFADPIIRKLCEIVFERTRVLSALYSNKETDDKENCIPTLHNIMNFNFEFDLRYNGENWLKSASKEAVTKVQNLLAGMILLYLAGEGGGPLMSFVWNQNEIEALVKNQILTKEEIDPLLIYLEIRDLVRTEAFMQERKLSDDDKKALADLLQRKELSDDIKRMLTNLLQERKLSDEDKRALADLFDLWSELSDDEKRRLTLSAYRRFYRGGLFGDCTKLSWEERLGLLPFMKVFQEYMNSPENLIKVDQSIYNTYLFRKDLIIRECSRVLHQPEAELENLFSRLVKLEVFITIKEELGVYRWSTDTSFRLFGFGNK